jgi:colanic acid/amylovoran biosynthesis glycosyltransferase
MDSKRSILYLIVSDYPYGFGEPFLEDELSVVAAAFQKIYIILPYPIKANKLQPKFHIPANAEVIELNIRESASDKLFAIKSVVSEAWRMELKFIRGIYKQPLQAIHLKVMAAYQAFANIFAQEMASLLQAHGHPAESITLYTYWFTNATYGCGILKQKSPKLRVVSRTHRWDCFYYVNPGDYLPFRPWMLKHSDGVYPISDAGTTYMKNQVDGYEQSKIKTFRLGVDIDAPQFAISKKNNKLRVLSIAFISKVKRIDRIIEALAITENCSIEWTHIGSAPNADDPVFELAKQKLSSLNHIKFQFLGEKSKEQIYNYLSSNQTDVLLCTSESEGIPVSMMEAIAHGIPLISVNVGGISEIIRNSVNGELLPAEASSPLIAKTLEKWAQLNENEFAQYSNQAFSSYLEYFSATKNYTRFLKEALQG